MWQYDKLSQEDQNTIIKLWAEDQIIKIIKILNESEVTRRPLSECCGRQQIKEKLAYGIDNGFIKATGRKV